MFRIVTAAAIALASAAGAHDFRLGDLVIDHPYAAAAAPGAGATAGYMTLTNEGAAPFRLTAVRSEAARMLQIHATELDSAGVARMVEQADGVEIPPGATVTFEPGGLHVMFMGLEAPFAVGDVVEATLVFEQGEVPVSFEVEQRAGAAGGHDHGHAHGQGD